MMYTILKDLPFIDEFEKVIISVVLKAEVW
jgi:hypothetical protein